MPPKDYYATLGVSEKATEAQIRKAYRKLAKAHHPDMHPGDKAAEEKFKEISQAYDTLSDPERRSKYDQLRKLGAGGFEPDFRGGSPWARASEQGFSAEDLGGLADLFSELFNRSGRYQHTGSGPAVGGNLETAIRVPFKTSISGGKVTVAFSRVERCSTCGGSGADPGSRVQKCPDCGGRGTVAFAKGAFSLSRPCPRCLGRGSIIDQPCSACGGTGESEAQRTLSVSIPPGIADGERIRLQGQGQPGTQGGPPGDLILSVRVSPDRFFTRRADDIYCEVPVGIVQATLGATVRVRTVHGSQRVAVKIPPGTQNGTKFRVPGMGVRRDSRKGDQYVIVKVNVPTQLTDRERQILKEFGRAREQGGGRQAD